VANTLNLFCNGAVGFIDWLGCTGPFGDRREPVVETLSRDGRMPAVGNYPRATIDVDVAAKCACVSKVNRRQPVLAALDDRPHAATATEVAHVIRLSEMPSAICRNAVTATTGAHMMSSRTAMPQAEKSANLLMTSAT
jgi:hypothetical protein